MESSSRCAHMSLPTLANVAYLVNAAFPFLQFNHRIETDVLLSHLGHALSLPVYGESPVPRRAVVDIGAWRGEFTAQALSVLGKIEARRVLAENTPEDWWPVGMDGFRVWPFLRGAVEQFVAVEPEPSTYAALEATSQRLGWQQAGFCALQSAVSHSDGTGWLDTAYALLL